MQNFNLSFAQLQLVKQIDEIRILLFDKPLDILAVNESKHDPLIRDSEVHIL